MSSNQKQKQKNINKKKRLTDEERILKYSQFNEDNVRVWKLEALDELSLEQLDKLYLKSIKLGIPIKVDRNIFFELWKRIQQIAKKH